MCHLILLLPFFGVSVFWLWPPAASIPIYLLILAVSGWVYYYTIAAMKRCAMSGPESLLNSQAEVVATYGHRLRVRAQGEVWSAHSKQELAPGDRVEVVGIGGLTLRVRNLQMAASPKLERPVSR